MPVVGLKVQQTYQIKGLTFIEGFNASVVERLRDDLLQAVFATSAAGVHLHVAEAQLLQTDTQTQPESQKEAGIKAKCSSTRHYLSQLREIEAPKCA